ncbi:HEAT repeat domain-containing protein [Streptomyces sp. Li-HN-5-11]|uniref:HEAT repeat domain-containing protein n=1 Tax=Streptomyces sp. Li-HN-5-11 TaxID=3075432 RepID=UPI0028ABB88B|nr:HEAT repeat domain-containing protein [Streptomyces sp. Li-HN-5-11]WNM32824.1 HEAT repeat domain-containing protein [Streptomyces sp. Li-HN-5-11]
MYQPSPEVARLRLLSDVEGLCQLVRTGDYWSARASVEFLADMADPRSAETLLWCLGESDEDHILRGRAAVALGRMHERRAVPLLPRLVADARTPGYLRRAAVEALGLVGDPSALGVLLKALDDGDIRYPAVVALGRLGRPEAAPAILRLRRPGYPLLPAEDMCEALGALGNPVAVEALALRLRTPEDDARRTAARCAAARALGRINTADCIPPLISALRDSDGSVAAAAAGALVEIDDAVPHLIKALDAPEAETRRRTCGILAERAAPVAAARLIHTLAHDRSALVRRAAAHALASVGTPDTVHALIAALDDRTVSDAAADALKRIPETPADVVAARLFEGDAHRQRIAARYLGLLGDARHCPALVRALEQVGHGARAAVVEALGRLGCAAARDALRETATCPDNPPSLRARAVQALGTIGNPGDTDLLLNSLGDDHGSVRLRAAEALGRLSCSRASTALGQVAFHDSDPDVRNAAVEALGSMDGTAVPVLLSLLSDSSATLRLAAARQLGRHADDRAIAALAGLSREEDPRMRSAALTALARLEDSRTIPPLIQALSVKDRWSPWNVSHVVILEALTRFEDRRAVEALVDHYPRCRSQESLRPLVGDIAQRGWDLGWLRQT